MTKSVMFCKPETLSLLLAAGANPSIQTVEGDTVFSIAERMQHIQMLEIIRRYTT